MIVETSPPRFDGVVRIMDDRERADVIVRTANPGPPARLLDKEQLAAKLQLHRADIRAQIAKPEFPQPTGYFRGRMLWDEAAIEAWLGEAFVAEPVPEAKTG